MVSKICRTCMLDKPVSDYYKHIQMSDGLLNICKTCIKARVAARAANKIEELREYDRKRGRTEHRKAKARDYQANNPDIHRKANVNYLQKHPDKYKAVTAVNNAIRDGRMLKQLCEVCLEFNTEAHHDDYSKPLEVRWLCDTHHKEHHRKLRELLRKAA